MKFELREIFNFDFLFYLIMLLAVILFTIYLFVRLYVSLLLNNAFIKIVFLTLLFIWIYYCIVNLTQDFFTFSSFNADSLLEISSGIMTTDLGVWIIVKFLDQCASINLKRKSAPNNPKQLKLEIESLVNEQEFNNNPEMEKLYETLQISALSIKKQKKILRSSFLKNMLISFFFFILGLIIPKIIMFFI